MNEITLNIENRHTMAFLNFLKTLNYVEIKTVKNDTLEDVQIANKKPRFANRVKMTDEQFEDIQQQLKTMRNEWERDTF